MMSWGMLVRKPPPATTSACGQSALAISTICLIERYAVVMPPSATTSQRSACSTWAITASEGRQALWSYTCTLWPWPTTMAARRAMP